MHRDCVDAVMAETLDEAVGAALGAHEHQRQIAVGPELVHERLEAERVLDLEEAVLDLRSGGRAGLVGVLAPDRVVRIATGGASGLAVERGGEEQRLPVCRTLADDPLDGREKAHVEHPIGLVEHEHPDATEAERSALEQVLEAPRRGDDDVRAGGLLGLSMQADAAVDGGHPQCAGMRDRVHLVRDLGHELAGRGENQRGGAPVMGLDAVDHRNGERKRLAGSGRRAHEHVEAGEHVADHELLDGEGFDDAAGGERVGDGSRHAQLGE